MLAKLSIRRLETYTPPLAAPLGAAGGRILTAAGEIAQVVNGSPFRFLSYLEFTPDMARGNHYHQNKEEYLYVLKGILRAVCRDLDSNETAHLELHAGDLLTIQPRCAHMFIAAEYAQAFEFSAEPFDPDDTYRYNLEQPDET